MWLLLLLLCSRFLLEIGSNGPTGKVKHIKFDFMREQISCGGGGGGG